MRIQENDVKPVGQDTVTGAAADAENELKMSDDDVTPAAAAAAASAPQDASLKIETTFEYDQIPCSATRDLVFMTTLRAPEAAAAESSSSSSSSSSSTRRSSAALGLIVVVDTSSSMEGTKLELMKKTLSFMVDQLRPKDRMALISFDSSVTVHTKDLLPVGQQQHTIKQAISRLRAGNTTNLSGGLIEAFSLLRNRNDLPEIVSILLFTDGLPTAGITKQEQIVRCVDSMLTQVKTKPTVYTFGFGSDHDPTLMSKLAQASQGGLYYYVQKEDEIPLAFGDALGGLLEIAAQSIKLELRGMNGTRVLKMLSTHGKAEIDLVNNCITVQAGDQLSEEQRDFLFRVEVPACLPTNEQPVVSVKLQYFSTIDGSFHDHEVIATINRPISTSGPLFASPVIEQQMQRVTWTETLDEAKGLADAGKLEEARKRVTQAKEAASHSAAYQAQDAYMHELVSEMGRMEMEDLASTSAYNAFGKQKMTNAWHAHSAQRAAGSESQDKMYANKGKKSKKAAFFNM